MNVYDSENHVYRSTRTRLPGATDVIKSEGLIDPTWMTEEARWRGKCVHRGLELLNKNELDWDTVEPDIQKYLLSYQQFLAVTKFQVIGCEEPCFDGAFACLPDVWGMINGYGAVVEFKTGPIPKWAAIQTALQKRALMASRGFNAVKRFGLRLMADGTLANLIRFEDPRDERVAMSMVESFHWKREHGYLDWK